jgi:hypothetical protein
MKYFSSLLKTAAIGFTAPLFIAITAIWFLFIR